METWEREVVLLQIIIKTCKSQCLGQPQSSSKVHAGIFLVSTYKAQDKESPNGPLITATSSALASARTVM